MNRHEHQGFIDEISKVASRKALWLTIDGGKAYKGRDLLKGKPRVRRKKGPQKIQGKPQIATFDQLRKMAAKTDGMTEEEILKARKLHKPQVVGSGQYKVKMKPKKIRAFNQRTGRMKKFKRVRYLLTDVPPEERTLKNIPKYADGKPKVRFQDWLLMKTEDGSIGKSEADGKWYGWSHRAISGFNSKEKAKRFARSVS